MDELLQSLLSRSPVWLNLVFIAIIIASVIFIIANRQYAKQTKAAFEEQLKLKDESYALLKQHKDEAIAILKESVMEMTRERDVYRERLHAERDAHQVTTHKLSEAQTRPDLTDVVRSITSHNEAMMRVMVKIELEIKNQVALTTRTARVMDHVISRLIEQKVLPADFKAVDNQA